MVKKMKKLPHTAEFKFKVGIDAIKGEKTIAELCSEYGVVSSQIFKWKRAILDQGADVFKTTTTQAHNQSTIDKLHATIGRLKVENDFLEQCAGRRL